MKKAFLMLTAAMLAASVAAAQQSPTKAKIKSGKRTIVGYIGDSQCGLKHPMEMGDDKTCTLKCVESGGQFILADRDNGIVYKLDKAGQQKARQFAGQKVKVTGTLNAKTKTIKVASIEAAS
jgi:hypothetical protein